MQQTCTFEASEVPASVRDNHKPELSGALAKRAGASRIETPIFEKDEHTSK